MRILVGRLALKLQQLSRRMCDKLWSLLVGGAFARFGRRSVLARPCRLEGTEHIGIGASVWIGPDSWLQCVPHESASADDTGISIGERVTASGSLVLSAAASIVVEDDVLFARNVYVSDHIHRYDDTSRPVHEQGVAKVDPVRIGKGAWLGQNVVVCPGVTIGKGAVIGAGSVVNADVPDYSVAVGAPARIVKSFADGPEAPGGRPTPMNATPENTAARGETASCRS